MDKIKQLSSVVRSIVPEHSIVPLVLSLAVNMFVYIGARLIAGNWYHCNMETSLDQMIPFWPPSAVIYLGCYIFWVVNYVLIARQEKKEVCLFFSGDLLSRVICLAFFLLIPTTNTRPVVENTGFWNRIMRLVYMVDEADNLFPSIHCLVSWFCFIGIRDRRDIPAWYRKFSCFMAVLICISTLTTKQHVIVDVAGGVFLAEVCFHMGRWKPVYSPYEKMIDRINGKLFGDRKGAYHAKQKKGAV